MYLAELRPSRKYVAAWDEIQCYAETDFLENPWDPSPGPFALQMDAGADQFVLLWKSKIQYRVSGAWNEQIFSGIPEMADNYLYNYIYNFSFFNSSNDSDKYFTYSVKPNSTFLSRFVVEASGQFRVYILPRTDNKWIKIWTEPEDQCQVYDVCGPQASCNNDNLPPCSCLQGFVHNHSHGWDSQWSSGCVQRFPLKCSHAGKRLTAVRFAELTGKSMPAEGIRYKRQGQRQCEAACVENCSCTAYTYVVDSTSRSTCFMWFGELLNISDTSNGISLFLPLNPSDFSYSPKKATPPRLVGGVTGGVVFFMAIGLVLLFLCCCRRSLGLSATEYAPATLTVYTYRVLKSATKNFSERLGSGGFGSVFKGILPDGSLVGVKRLESVSQGEKQFRMEVSTIGTMQHVNLVRLLGFCIKGSRRLLVYEYMPNGCLSDFLFSKTQSDDQQKELDWKTRFGIVVGTARGIVYLHDNCRDCIIHCDIKPENILLDSNFCPKLSDFGLAKPLGREYSKVLTTMRGTRGYLAPEWISGLPITVKTDVYSFGMTLLEIIAGRRNMDGDLDSGELFFSAWAATQVSSGNVTEVLDKKLMNLNNIEVEQVRRAAIVGVWCIQDEQENRPTISQVLKILEGVVDTPPLPPVPLSIQRFTQTASNLGLFWENDPYASAHNSRDHPSTPL